jgi:hypothetical protein
MTTNGSRLKAVSRQGRVLLREKAKVFVYGTRDGGAAHTNLAGAVDFGTTEILSEAHQAQLQQAFS